MGTPQFPAIDSDTKQLPDVVRARIAANLQDASTPEGAAVRAGRVNEEATVMNGRQYRITADSFGTNALTKPYVDIIAQARNMVETNNAVSGSYFQDGANRAWGTVAPITGLPTDSFGHIAFGINPGNFSTNQALTRPVERAAFETLLWLMAADSRYPQSNWTLTNTWTDYTGSAEAGTTSGGSAKLTAVVGAYAEITPPAGDYVAVGAGFSTNVGLVMGSGTYAKNGTTVFPNQVNQAPQSHNGSNLAPRPVRLLGLTGTDVIRATNVTGNDYMIVDDLIKLSATPPWIIVVKPTYMIPGEYSIPDATVDLYRQDIDAVVSSVTQAYKPLRGRVIVVDPVTSGWDRTIHTGSDGLHPSAAGAAFLADLVQRQVSYATRLRAQLVASGLI
jgi:hypothetical protein